MNKTKSLEQATKTIQPDIQWQHLITRLTLNNLEEEPMRHKMRLLRSIGLSTCFEAYQAMPPVQNVSKRSEKTDRGIFILCVNCVVGLLSTSGFIFANFIDLFQLVHYFQFCHPPAETWSADGWLFPGKEMGQPSDSNWRAELSLDEAAHAVVPFG